MHSDLRFLVIWPLLYLLFEFDSAINQERSSWSYAYEKKKDIIVDVQYGRRTVDVPSGNKRIALVTT